MDVQGDGLGGEDAERARRDDPARSGALSRERVGRALGEWQAAELKLARSFAECRGLTPEQLEDLYQETAVVLLERTYHHEDHLRNALRWGIKHRALHLHRNERRRGEILQQRGPELQGAAEAREQARDPEPAAVLAQDRLVVAEFLCGLSELEQRVFWLVAEGLRYRAIAPVLGIEVNEARRAARSCERERERFQLLYDTGRMCGYRAHTIRALKDGRGASQRLAAAAFAHLDGCARCRAEHRTNAGRLRRSFQRDSLALIGAPFLAHPAGLFARVQLRARGLVQRVADLAPMPGGAGREGVVALVAGGGAAAKIAAAATTVVVIAAGTLGATHALQPPHGHGISAHTAKRSPRPVPAAAAAASPTFAAGVNRRATSSAGVPRAGGREPGGFAFLGVAGTSSRSGVAGGARTARVRRGAPPQGTAETEVHRGGGGPFGP